MSLMETRLSLCRHDQMGTSVLRCVSARIRPSQCMAAVKRRMSPIVSGPRMSSVALGRISQAHVQQLKLLSGEHAASQVLGRSPTADLGLLSVPTSPHLTSPSSCTSGPPPHACGISSSSSFLLARDETILSLVRSPSPAPTKSIDRPPDRASLWLSLHAHTDGRGRASERASERMEGRRASFVRQVTDSEFTALALRPLVGRGEGGEGDSSLPASDGRPASYSSSAERTRERASKTGRKEEGV